MNVFRNIFPNSKHHQHHVFRLILGMEVYFRCFLSPMLWVELRLIELFHYFRENVEQFASKVIGTRLPLISLCCHGDKKKYQSVVSCALKSTR